MKTASASIALVLTSIVVATPVARADNPLLASATPAVIVTDQQLDKVKGTGLQSNLDGYWGNYYASQALQSGTLGNYYNYLGNSAAKTNYFNAAFYAYTAGNRYIDAYNHF